MYYPNLTCLQRALVVNMKKHYLQLTLSITARFLFICFDNCATLSKEGGFGVRVAM